MSSDFVRRLWRQAPVGAPIPEHLIWRMAKNGRFAEARMRIVAGRPELRIYVQHPTPEFQLLFSVVTTDQELDSQAALQRQLFEAKGWSA